MLHFEVTTSEPGNAEPEAVVALSCGSCLGQARHTPEALRSIEPTAGDTRDVRPLLGPEE